MNNQEVSLLASAVENSVMSALFNAAREPEREKYWRDYADKMELKFTNQHGRHYSYFISRGQP
jgi:hypothetical protein